MKTAIIAGKSLPAWREPSGLRSARDTILELGRTSHEHAYVVGKTLAWVKKRVGHGEFIPWIKKNIWFSERTAQYMMSFAARCDKQGRLAEYRPASARSSEKSPLTLDQREEKVRKFIDRLYGDLGTERVIVLRNMLVSVADFFAVELEKPCA
jgi:DUF3102 family protein